MRKFRNIIVLLFCFICSYAQNQSRISYEQAQEIVQKNIEISDQMDLFVCDTIVQADSKIKSMGKVFSSPSFTSWLFFIDNYPLANWDNEITIKENTEVTLGTSLTLTPQ